MIPSNISVICNDIIPDLEKKSDKDSSELIP